ncbi:MAG: tRNA 2-selenouridine(34) synthase MnmH [Hydrogenophaga sp.]|uniref:tRNA 2-selenouridine(34) synthase MnmH n=1 Tax=Hydrogenophaga sp. TaxID=1904254 RepID=UPI001BBD867C|nr:tRNA 2-selenouridine(34) synthase MnmH [Hydrogenophaga sp.]MBS3911453.1 tRNA 2-selenouridine(34) synthase MnmH [Hydrogenophaga sp.]MDO9148647.1 tRNA 2-selenouridine(34) synthase MnmH [Hydrogenophaga sp.]MDO9605304.1 tRNA 2-selenouridine(34) synthase MnmH [Hydrogenophaga sp.]MDP2163789.1 tRNA 2-selenouridine(34) synthase MnmH [Hydrogenophaga sp.]MDP3474912.1 tRNA 2-selenouridine(34) synthase MnmH [Hydrogenophaga sp.]
MPVHTLPACDVLTRLADFDTLIDARTEDEYALDHVPGAINWPTLNNAERITIGTMYKQVNAFEAKKRGAALSARNIAAHIERDVLDKPRAWKPLVYCWRGGNRSGALATILGAIGFQVTLIDGGYKAWRAALVEDIPRLAQRLHYRVVCGPTGSGKTRLLHALAAQGAQVLDLEALANHRSSVLGHIPGVEQPSQKRFDSLIWDALRPFEPVRPVFVESESKKVGNVRVPDTLIDAMRQSPCIDLQLSDPERVALLLEDYDFFVTDSEHFCRRLEALTELRGGAVVGGWIDRVRQGQTSAVVLELLTQHYDPMYAQSIERNFKQFGQAIPCVLPNRSVAALAEAARRLTACEVDPAPN